MHEHAPQNLHDLPQAAARFVRLVAEQLEAARQLGELSCSQSALLAQGEIEAATEVIAQRQALVDRLATTAEQLEPLAGVMGKLLPHIAHDVRGLIPGQLAEIDGLIAAVNARDEADARCLREHHAGAGEELAALGRSRSALGAYDDERGGVGASFQDREG